MHGTTEVRCMTQSSSSEGTVINLTVISSSEPEPEEESDLAYPANVPSSYPHSLLWLCRLRTGDCESYDSPLTAGSLNHTSHNLTPFLALPADCVLNQVDHSLILPAEFCTLVTTSLFLYFPISSFLISSFLLLGQPQHNAPTTILLAGSRAQ